MLPELLCRCFVCFVLFTVIWVHILVPYLVLCLLSDFVCANVNIVWISTSASESHASIEDIFF